MNYSHFSSLGYAVHNHSGYHIVNPAKQFFGVREKYSSSVSDAVFNYNLEGDVTTFENELRKYPVSFVWFFATWCGHCTTMEKDFKIAAEEFLGTVRFIKVDAEKYRELSVKYDIQGYPTLKLFRAGEPPVEYEGKRNANAFINWLQQRV